MKRIKSYIKRFIVDVIVADWKSDGPIRRMVMDEVSSAGDACVRLSNY
jgi:hypothetical protein